MIKKGKEIKMGKTYKDYKVISGTVDSKNPTSVYINISAWGNPINEDVDNYTSVISSLKKDIKRYLYKTLPHSFSTHNTIVDLDIRESGIHFGKRSYMSCEVTLYQNNPNTLKLLKSTELKKSMGDITDNLINEIFDKNDYFDFFKKKK